MKKRIISLFAAAAMTLGLSVVTVHAENDISVVLDGEKLAFDQAPVMINDRTMVPLRAIFEALGASVDWDENTRTVTSTKDGTTVKLTIGENKFYRDGAAVPLDVPGTIVNERTLVPVRAISEAYNCWVGWDGRTQTVKISSVASEALRQYAKTNLSVLHQEIHDSGEILTYTDVRFLLADVSDDSEPELIAVGVADGDFTYMAYFEIYRYENGNIVKIGSDFIGGAYGRVMSLVRYNGEVRVHYSSYSSSNGFLDKVMKYKDGEWADDYSSYEEYNWETDGSVKGYILNGEYVSEAEIEAAREKAEANSLTLEDFGSL